MRLGVHPENGAHDIRLVRVHLQRPVDLEPVAERRAAEAQSPGGLGLHALADTLAARACSAVERPEGVLKRVGLLLVVADHRALEAVELEHAPHLLQQRRADMRRARDDHQVSQPRAVDVVDQTGPTRAELRSGRIWRARLVAENALGEMVAHRAEALERLRQYPVRAGVVGWHGEVTEGSHRQSASSSRPQLGHGTGEALVRTVCATLFGTPTRHDEQVAFRRCATASPAWFLRTRS